MNAKDEMVFAAIVTAVHKAIKAVGGVAGVRKMSIFPSSSKASEIEKKAA